MSVIKCPRCEINFIQEEDGYCPICKKEMAGERVEEPTVDICIECGERPALAGEELCLECLKEHQLVIAPVELMEEEDKDDDEAILPEEEEDTEDIEDEDDLFKPVVIDKKIAIDPEWDELGDEPEDEFDGFYAEDVNELAELVENELDDYMKQ